MTDRVRALFFASLALIAGELARFGITVGTFSSIFVAAPILRWVYRRWKAGGARAGLSPMRGA